LLLGADFARTTIRDRQAGGAARAGPGVHSEGMSTDTRGLWPWNWWSGLSGAPQRLSQPILPGWTVAPVVTITGVNSSAPQTEAEVVQRHSYGRQLGRIADALQALVDERAETAPGDPRLTAFTEMKNEIDDIKLEAATDRVDRLRADLADLKSERPAEYHRLRDALREVLDDAS
jgi:hypothetical protein